MKYILDEKEYENYNALNNGWTEKVNLELFKELYNLKKQGAKEVFISEFEEAIILMNTQFVNFSEYAESVKPLYEDEIGMFLGMRIRVFKRLGQIGCKLE